MTGPVALTRRRLLRGLGLGVGAGLGLGALAACSDSDDDTGTTGTSPVPLGDTVTASASSKGSASAKGAPKVVRTIASGLAVPWGVGFLPDRSALVTERDSGRVLAVSAGGKVRTVGTLHADGGPGTESGLLGLAVSPTYRKDRLVFLYLSTTTDNRIVRATYDGKRLGTPHVILRGIPSGPIHDGGRLAFGPDGYLYASTGETGDPDLAQDLDSLGGKILRLTTEGQPAPGNPFPGSAVWSYGHRNVQGLAWDQRGQLWASEFGDQEWDELNLIVPGGDYGWPDTEGSGGTDDQPAVVWPTNSASPSGLAFLDGHLWLGALEGERLWRVTLNGPAATDPTAFFVGDYGRLRTVVTAPDGRLWVTTSNRDGRGTPAATDDRILEVAVG